MGRRILFSQILLLQILQAWGLSLLGCPAEKGIRGASQLRMKRVFTQLLSGSGDLGDEEMVSELEVLMAEHSGTAALQHIPARALFLATDDRPLPCVPGILTTEFLQLLWLKYTMPTKAMNLLLHSDRHFTLLRPNFISCSASFLRLDLRPVVRFLRTTSWATILRLGYGLIFGLGPLLGDENVV